jgi:hypothetical protein
MSAWATVLLGDIIAFLTACPYTFAGDLGGSVAINPLALGLMPLAVSQPVYRLARVIKPRFLVVEEIVVTGSGLVLLAAMLCVSTV